MVKRVMRKLSKISQSKFKKKQVRKSKLVSIYHFLFSFRSPPMKKKKWKAPKKPRKQEEDEKVNLEDLALQLLKQ